MVSPKDDRNVKPTDTGSPPEASDPFRLENIFADATQVFKPNRVNQAASPDVIIALDTNVLLLPYTIRKEGLPKLQKFYQHLRAENRLYLPARVAREFIVHRDRKLSELLKMITDVRSRLNIGETRLSPILEGIEGSDAMASASKALADAKGLYTKAIGVIEEQVMSWSGDDPVTSIYDTVFDAENMISPTETNDEILLEWKSRLKERIPPGYKDGGKPDTGIGDFLVWKALLVIGQRYNKDLIFVTGEEKADWFVRVNGAGAYPRPELVAEYRKHSGGRGLRLVEFHDVLREMDVAQDIVTEVEKAETTANNIVRVNSQYDLRYDHTFRTEVRSPLGAVFFVDFRMRYGGSDLTFSTDGASFTFAVSEQGADSLWAYPNDRVPAIAVFTGNIGDRIDPRLIMPAESAISVSRGQTILVSNSDGFTLVARLVRASQPKLGEPFEATFVSAIYPPTGAIINP